MNQAVPSADIALRIGLAARALPDTDIARLLKVLADAIGLPPTQDKLDGLRVKDLKQAAAGELAEVDQGALKRALDLLKGEGMADIAPPPPVEPYCDGDLPDSLRVACASNSGERLDGPFGSCARYLIYQVAATEYRLIACRGIDAMAADAEHTAQRIALVADCDIVFAVSLGGPAAARLIKAGVHPLKRPEGGPARAEAEALQAVLAEQRLPPWLAKRRQGIA